MEDQKIVSLYWQREESAIEHTQRKYGKFLLGVARNILADLEDSKESVNDTYLHAWNSMPPHRPSVLSAFLAKITRRVSVDRLRKRNSQKRGGNQYVMSLSELSESISEGDTTQQAFSEYLLNQAVEEYVRSLPQEKRTVFLLRYFFLDSVRDIARHCDVSESKVKTMLFRCRQELAEYLKKEGLL